MDVLVTFGPAKWVIREVGMRLQFAAMVKNAEPDNGSDDAHTVGGVMESLAACSVMEILNTIQLFLNDRVTIDGLTDSLDPLLEPKPAKITFGARPERRSGSPSARVAKQRNRELVSSTFSSPTFREDRARQPATPSANATPVAPCIFCNENHLHRHCKRFVTYDERMRQIKAKKACTRCLRPNHVADQCRAYPKCFTCHQRGHRSALCPNDQPRNESSMVAHEAKPKIDSSLRSKDTSAGKPSSGTADTNKTTTGLLAMMGTEEQSILSSAIVSIRNPKTDERVTAPLLFDSASSSSYITEDLANRLHLERSAPFRRTVATFASEGSTETECTKAQADVMLKDGNSISIHADIIPFITKTSITPITLPDDISDFIKSMPYAMADNYETTGPPDILLGNDYFLWFLSGVPRLLAHHVCYIPTKVGIVLGGSFTSKEAESSIVNPIFLTIHDRPAYDISFESTDFEPSKKEPNLAKFWRLEDIGITDDPKDNSDDLAERHFQDTAKFVENRWELGWPYNEKIDMLASNFGQAYGRFVSLAKRLQEPDECVRTEYANVIDKQVEFGIIEEVPLPEIKNTANRVHYLSHHAVIRTDHSTTRMRIVYDSSGKAGRKALSLNQCVHRGPVILPDLVALILRFRLNRVAIIADIEKAFLQLSLRPSDRDVTRFLWFKDPKSPTPQLYRTMRFRRVLFGVISSPSLLAQTIQHHLKRTGTDIASTIAEHMYVDNCIVSLANDEQATTFYKEAKCVFNQCSMNLREWMSNSDSLMQAIEEKDRCGSRNAKILGLKWNSETDSLRLNGDWSKYSNCSTKREVVQGIASVFDPTGMYQPVILRAKLLLKTLGDRT